MGEPLSQKVLTTDLEDSGTCWPVETAIYDKTIN